MLIKSVYAGELTDKEKTNILMHIMLVKYNFDFGLKGFPKKQKCVNVVRDPI